MNTMMPLRHKTVLLPLGLALFAPFFWIAFLVSGTEQSDYGRQVIKDEFVITMLIPGVALWAGGVVLALSYYRISKTINLYCTYVWSGISVLLGIAVLYVFAMCLIPYEGSSGDWFFSRSAVNAEDTMRGGLLGAAFLGILAIPAWIHYGLIRGGKHYDATHNPDGTIRHGRIEE